MKLQETFIKEQKFLGDKGINTWKLLYEMTDLDILKFSAEGKCSSRNLKCLRCISTFICKLDLQVNEASLLIHSGFASIDSLSNASPNELLRKITQLELLLTNQRITKTDLSKVCKWIKKAQIYKKSINE